MTDRELKSIFEQYMDAHESEMTEDVIRLCRIPSVRGEAAENAPYGIEARRALSEAEKLLRKYGFRTRVYENRVVSGDLNDLERKLDILSHMDVVAPGDGWTVTGPFEPTVKDGAIYGRGTSDDKGPAAAAIYAARAVKELGIPLSAGCRLVFGSDEECGSSDLPCYLETEGEAPMTWTADSEFPITNIEKGQLRGTVGISRVCGTFSGSLSEKRLVSLRSGEAVNIVPGHAAAVFKGVSEAELESAAGSFAEKHPEAVFSYRISSARDETSIEVSGNTAHASTPEKGVNAAVIALHIAIGAVSDENLRKLAELFPFGDHEGSALAADIRDVLSGKTSVSPDLWDISNERISVKFDMRTCASFEENDGPERVREAVMKKGFDYEYTFARPHIVSEDSFFVRTLSKMYTLVTGLPGRCQAIGGGTYVHNFARGVAFGAVGESTDTHMHGPDEFMPIGELKTAAVIYALCIVKLIGTREMPEPEA